MTSSHKIVFTGKMPWLLRAVTVLLIPVNLLAAVPPLVVAAAIAPAPVLLQPPASAFAAQVPSIAPHPPAIPKFDPPSAASGLSPLASGLTNPTDRDLITARCFEVPLVPQAGDPIPGENVDLAQALTVFHGAPQNFSPLTAFLAKFPDSRWKASLLTNLGLLYRAQGRWSKALSAFEQAWSLEKAATTPLQKAVADRTLGELARFYAHLGKTEQLDALLDETKGRDVRGAGSARLTEARRADELMKSDPGEAFRCGPFAVGQICHLLNLGGKATHEVHQFKSTSQGTNLAGLQNLMNHIGLAYQTAFRAPGAAVPVPCIVHWKVGHFSVLVKKVGANYLARDPGLGPDTLLSPAALDEEASGYFFVPSGALPPGWRIVANAEAKAVFGQGSTNGPPTPPPPTDCICEGMTTYQLEKDSITLALRDAPVGYAPPVGPAIQFTANYNNQEPADTTNLSNLGPNWSFKWLCYIQATSTADNATVSYGPGGGQLSYTGYNATTGSFAQQQISNDTLTLNANGTYTLTHPDGARELFNLIGPGATPTAFRTQSIDPRGNAITYNYDSYYRLVTVTDALGQTTVLSYDNSTDPTNPAFYNVTQVTDPFGRFAIFQYNVSGQLASITDVLGITSSFTYGPGGFVTSLTTPYGTTQFAASYSSTDDWVQVTDPAGGQERAEWANDSTTLANCPLTDSDPANLVPAGFSNTDLTARNTFFWDKQAMAVAPGDYTKAEIIHWLHLTASNYNLQSDTIESIKKPFENRVWCAYPNQSGGTIVCGTGSQPSKIARILDNGTEQDYQYQYNAAGNRTQSIDPLGRTTNYNYAANGIDLTSVTQQNGSGNDILATNTYYSQHLLHTTTDASGQTTTYTYNSAGQVSTITDAKNEVTSFYYDPKGAANTTDATRTGYLVSVVGPAVNSPTGPTTILTYDGFGRINSMTDSEGYTVAATFDNADRPLTITYPDGTYNQILYNRLDAEWTKDRRGRWTHQLHDADRHVVVQEDPLLRKTSYDWCNCGALAGITDPAGNTTTWLRDAQSRITQKIYPNQSAVTYAYETTTSRLKSVTDALNQTTNYTYNLDNSLNQVSYTNAVNPTPAVSFGYDPNYLRLTSMTDCAGLTNYAYNPVPPAPITTPVTGANQLYTVTGPLANSTIAYTYDELGRVLGTSINGSANTSSVAYDALGRVTSAANPLGNFGYTYVNQTNRLSQVTYPNGQVTNYGYYPNVPATGNSPGNDDQRLQSITNLSTAGSNLSTFNYTYDAEGIIQTWTKQLDSGSQLTSSFGYDLVDQLISASVPSVSSVVQNYAYSYDIAGNRLTEQIDPSVTTSAFNNLNQLTGQSPGGLMQFSGTVNEPVTATVGGNPATVVAAGGGVYNWQGKALVTAGANSIPLAGTDANGHTTTTTLTGTVSGGAARTLMYDANGNLTNDGNGKTYAWDARNRLISVTQTVNGVQTVTGYVYDGMGRRVQETSNGAIVKQWVWQPWNAQPSEERDGSNNVTKRFYWQGEQISGANYYYTKDHLGSIREMTNSTGGLVARYDYDPYGRRTLVSGTDLADFGFTCFYYDQASGLWFSRTRAYDPNLGRWLGRDPLGERGGSNLYRYCLNDPLNYYDPFGLCPNDGSSNGYGTFQFGINFSGSGGISGNSTTGLIIDAHGNVGAFQTYSGGAGVGVSGGVTGYFGLSNAPDILGYRQWSIDGSASGGYIVGGSIDYSTWPTGGGANGTCPFHEGGFSVGGEEGASAQITGTYTKVTPLFNILNIIPRIGGPGDNGPFDPGPAY